MVMETDRDVGLGWDAEIGNQLLALTRDTSLLAISRPLKRNNPPSLIVEHQDDRQLAIDPIL